MKYGKLIDGKVEYAGKTIVVDGIVHTYPTEADYLLAGYKPVIDERPYTSPTEYAVAVGWEELENSISRFYEIRPVEVTVEDYNRAMEEHLRAEREARGYTDREPTDYRNDPFPRFAQDAEDWLIHRSSVMVFALGVLNEFKASGKAPMSLDEFRAALPQITWTEE